MKRSTSLPRPRFIPRMTTAVMVLLLVSAARADFNVIPLPDAPYVGATTLIPITDPDFTAVASLTDGTQTVNFDISLAASTVPDTWATWGSPPDTEGASPRVLWTSGFTSATLDFLDSTTFGFELEPNTATTSAFTADFYNGATLIGSIPLNVDGDAGAKLFAASTTTSAFNKVVISGNDDFAIAQVRYTLAAAIPEPASLGVFALAGIGLWRRRR